MPEFAKMIEAIADKMQPLRDRTGAPGRPKGGRDAYWHASIWINTEMLVLAAKRRGIPAARARVVRDLARRYRLSPKSISLSVAEGRRLVYAHDLRALEAVQDMSMLLALIHLREHD